MLHYSMILKKLNIIYLKKLKLQFEISIFLFLKNLISNLMSRYKLKSNWKKKRKKKRNMLQPQVKYAKCKEPYIVDCMHILRKET